MIRHRLFFRLSGALADAISVAVPAEAATALPPRGRFPHRNGAGPAGVRCADAAAPLDSVGAVARMQRLRWIPFGLLRGRNGSAGFRWSFCADAAAPLDSVRAVARMQRLRRIPLELLRRRSGSAGFCSASCASRWRRTASVIVRYSSVLGRTYSSTVSIGSTSGSDVGRGCMSVIPLNFDIPMFRWRRPAPDVSFLVISWSAWFVFFGFGLCDISFFNFSEKYVTFKAPL